MNYNRSIRVLCSALAVGMALLAAPGAHGAIFDFSAQYEGVTAAQGAGVVSMSVFDEGRLLTKSTNVVSGTSFDLSAVNGVVVWSSVSQVYYYTYDPDLGRWMGGTITSGAPANDLRTTNGIVTWSVSASGTVHYRVYDRNRGAWQAGSSTATSAPSNLGTVDGTVAWSISGPGGSARARVYDPIKGAWQARDVSPVNVGAFLNTDGVVTFGDATSGTVYYHTYDPTRAGWQNGSTGGGAPYDLRSFNGVVAWSVNPAVRYTVYNPANGSWQSGSEPGAGYTADLSISNSVVTWSTATASYARGYDPGGGWGNGPAVGLAYFAVSTNNANAPLWVHFIDLSLGGASWAWSFGDGATSTRRSPAHRYTSLGAFLATESVTGSFGSSAARRLIITDVTLPSGTVLINGGSAFTTNPAVTLALSATDNSGSVSFMRVANSAIFGPWEPYATNKAWTLAAGNGNKTVFAQFADSATNISANAADTIQLDTTPPPVVSVVATNFTEGAGAVTVRVNLGTSFNRLVSINYATANDTAVAGLDYTSIFGRLDFTPGATVQTFTIPITQDQAVELNETFQIILSNPTNCLPVSPGLVTILDDDLPTVSFATTNFVVSEGAAYALITAQLNAPSGRDVALGFVATNGTAEAGFDFVATNGLLTIPAGLTNGTFPVLLLNDALDEFSETVLLRLTTLTNARPAAPTNALLTIVDDDAKSLGFSRPLYTVFENAFFVQVNVWLSKPVALDVSFDYEVFGGTATPGADYVPASDRRTITAGSTNVTLFVILQNDSSPEPDETIHLALSNLSGAAPGPIVEADVLIYDDDRPPRLLAPRRGTNGLFQATAFGPTGQAFTVQISSNLSVWASALRLTNVTGTLDFSDPDSLSASNRFYRTSQP